MMMTITIDVEVEQCLSPMEEMDLQETIAELAGVDSSEVEMDVTYDD